MVSPIVNEQDDLVTW